MLKMLTTLALAFAVLAGCQKDPIMAPETGYGDPLPLRDYPKIALTGGLGQYLVFGQPNVQGPLENRPMDIQVPVRAMDDFHFETQYMFEWYDQTGRQVGDTGWKYQRLPGRVQQHFNGNALDTNVTDWRLIVRPAR